jgi:Family of unknown function (DUF6200)
MGETTSRRHARRTTSRRHVRRSGRAATDSQSAAIPSAMIIDLKTQNPKRVQQLRRGRGRLMRIVEDTILDMQQERGEQEPNQPIIVIVERSRRRRRWRRSLWTSSNLVYQPMIG